MYNNKAQTSRGCCLRKNKLAAEVATDEFVDLNNDFTLFMPFFVGVVCRGYYNKNV